jgi:hypothetical protein
MPTDEEGVVRQVEVSGQEGKKRFSLSCRCWRFGVRRKGARSYGPRPATAPGTALGLLASRALSSAQVSNNVAECQPEDKHPNDRMQ